MSELIDSVVRQQVMVEGLKVSAHDEFLPYLKRIDRLVRDRLLDEGEIISTKKDLNAVLADLKDGQVEIYDEYQSWIDDLLEQLTEDQAEVSVLTLDNVTKGASVTLPLLAVLMAALRRTPMQLDGYNGSLYVEPYMRQLTANQIAMVQNEITRGQTQGLTVAQISRNIRGTKALQYKNGALNRVNMSNRALVHTALAHASSQARHTTMAANKDILLGYEILATLDGHTSDICRTYDQLKKVYEIGNGPLPPFHIACRSTTLEVINPKYNLLAGTPEDRPSSGANGAASVDGNTGYYDWLRTQPISFQNTAIGTTRAALLRNGGISANEFAELNLGRNFRPLTLAQMRQLRPEIFERANL